MRTRAPRSALCAALPLVLGAALAAQSANVFTTPATHAVTVLASGPREGAPGERFLNVEGRNKNKFASYAVVRFDTAALKREMEQRLGAGKYEIADVTLSLAQSNADFTRDGSVHVYYSADAAVEIGGAASRLRYPYDPKVGPLRGESLGTVRFAAAESDGRVDSYSLSKGPASAALAAAVLHGRVVTLVLCEAQPGVAATWAGMKPVGGRKPPTLVVRAAARPQGR